MLSAEAMPASLAAMAIFATTFESKREENNDRDSVRKQSFCIIFNESKTLKIGLQLKQFSTENQPGQASSHTYA